MPRVIAMVDERFPPRLANSRAVSQSERQTTHLAEQQFQIIATLFSHAASGCYNILTCCSPLGRSTTAWSRSLEAVDSDNVSICLHAT